jgi:signal peptide peptidase SppA
MNDTQLKCAAQHFGLWAVWPKWFTEALTAVKSGMFRAQTQYQTDADGNVVYTWDVTDGIATIPIRGQTQKGDSSFGGTSTVRVRRALREAYGRSDVRSVLLHVDEAPGGTVAGTDDLARDIAEAPKGMDVYAQIDDLGASAAYWLASQAKKVFANPTALVGSIGVYTVLEDTSGAYELAGVKAHLVSSGPYKGAGVAGVPVTEEMIAGVKEIVDDTNEHFLAAIMSGRGMDKASAKGVADGRVWIASKAKRLGLIDGIQTLDQTIAQIREQNAARDAKRAASRKAKASLDDILLR